MKTVADRFWEKVNKDGPIVRPELGQCWVWTAATDTFGYGRFGISCINRVAYRVAWELANGAVPLGLWVLHKCDNPPCIRPEHLWLGTRIDNINDMYAKGRRPVNVKVLSKMWDRNRSKTHCPMGHEYTPDNTIREQRGRSICRRCRICKRVSDRQSHAVRYARLKEQMGESCPS